MTLIEKKYVIAIMLALVVGPVLYLIALGPAIFSDPIPEYPSEPPIEANRSADCLPNTMYVTEALTGYSDNEVINPRCFELQKRLVKAAESGELHSLRLVISQGANVNSPGQVSGGDFYPALVRAVLTRQTAAVKLLLDNGGNADEAYICCMTHESILMLAIKNSDIETMKLLISRGANLSFQGRFERSIFDEIDESPDPKIRDLFASVCDRSISCRVKRRAFKLWPH